MKVNSRLYSWAREVQAKEGSFSPEVFNEAVESETDERIINMLNRFKNSDEVFEALSDSFKVIESCE